LIKIAVVPFNTTTFAFLSFIPQGVLVTLNNLILIVALLIGLSPASAWAADCEQTTSNDDIIRVAAEGEVAYAEQRSSDLQMIFPRAVDIVECLGEKLDPTAAAAFHRLMAISHLFARDSDALKAELSAARRLDGDYSYDVLVGGVSNHPLSNFYEQAATFQPEGATTLRVANGSHNVGGIPAAPWFTNLPGVIQAFRQTDGTDDEVLWKTAYIRAGQDLPAWAVAPELPPAPVVRRGGLMTKPWFYYATSGALAAAAGGTYMASNSARNSYQDPSTPSGDLTGLESRTNGLGTTSVILFSAAGVALVPAITFHFGGKKGDKPSAELTYNR
jgi:hypothetical protein